MGVHRDTQALSYNINNVYTIVDKLNSLNNIDIKVWYLRIAASEHQ